MLATDRLWMDPEGLRWRVSMEYAGSGTSEAPDSCFILAWVREGGEPRFFTTPAHATYDLHELSETDLRCLWSRRAGPAEAVPALSVPWTRATCSVVGNESESGD